MSIAYLPVRTSFDLETLDDDEVVEGYRDGLRGEPEPNGNRSRSYWHGWRNGMVDSGRRKSDKHQRELVRATRDDGTFAKLFGEPR